MRGLVVVLAACTSAGDPTPADERPDALSVDAPPAPAPIASVRVVARTGALLAAYRSGGEWMPLALDTHGEATITVQGPYEVVIACGGALPFGGDEYQTVIVRRTSADEPTIRPFCAANPPPSTRVEVQGQVAQTATAYLGLDQRSGTGAWTYHVHVEPGMHELVATDGARIAIRRDVAITGAMTLPRIDLVTGVALEQANVIVQGANGETPILGTELVLAHDQLALGGGKLVPASALAPGDAQSVTAHVDRRYASTRVAGGTTTIVLPPPITGVTFTADGATWNPSFEAHVSIRLQSEVAEVGRPVQERVLDVDASARWLAGARSITADLGIPGYRAAWRRDALASPREHHQLELDTHDAGSTMTVFAGD